MNSNTLTRACGIAACCIAAPAFAQNYDATAILDDGGYYVYLEDANTVVTEVSGNIAGLSLSLEHVAPSRLATDFNISPLSEFNFASIANTQGSLIAVWGWNDPNSPAPDDGIAVAVPCRSSGTPPINLNGTGYQGAGLYGVQFQDTTYQQAYNSYRTWVNGGGGNPQFLGDNLTLGDFQSEAYRCKIGTGGGNFIVGNPESVQFAQIADGLDLSQPVLLDDDPSWGVGLRVGRAEFGGQEGALVGARINRSFRPFEGTRTLVTVDVPVTFISVGGRQQYRGHAAVGATYPVNPNLAITPRVSYGFAHSPDEKLTGQVAAATLAATYTLPQQIGRGRVTLGGLVGYSKVVSVESNGTKLEGNANTANTSFRGAAAYDLPLDTRVFGRQASARASYALTQMSGDKLAVGSVHEISASLGVRPRETDARSRFELLRMGVLALLADQNNSLSVFAGYRF